MPETRRRRYGNWTRFDFQPTPAMASYLLVLCAGELESIGTRAAGVDVRVVTTRGKSEGGRYALASAAKLLRYYNDYFGVRYPLPKVDLIAHPGGYTGAMENWGGITFHEARLLYDPRRSSTADQQDTFMIVAHELAHSWTGNLVTNASAEHFWLNEGFTVFAERRILEALEGPELAALHAALGRRSLETAIEHFRAHPQLTALRTHLTGIDPDDVFSQVPYEKGYLLLCALEAAVGRPAFDAYLRKYIDTFRFQALTTEDWMAFTERELPGALAKVNAEQYLHQPGIPASAPSPHSRRLEELERLKGTAPSVEAVKDWTPAEWQLFLEWLPTELSRDTLRTMDERFHFTQSTNSEVLVSWLVAALRGQYAPALARTEQFLGEVGRMKYLKPLYSVLHSTKEYRAKARELFQKYAERYHPIARQGIEGILSRA